MRGLHDGMSLLKRGYATIASGKSLRGKGPVLTLEHVGLSVKQNAHYG